MKVNDLGRVVFITGAGISKESGIPTFRGDDGYYRTRQPISIDQFESDPASVWEEIRERREIIHQAQPNRAHQILVEIEKNLQDDFLLVTQNIDNLHREAGSQRLLEVHGNIWSLKEESSTKEHEFLEMIDSGNYQHLGYTRLEYLLMLSNCDFCQTIDQEYQQNETPVGFRPNITFLGEGLSHRMVAFHEFCQEKVDHVIIIGSSLTISTAPMMAYSIKQTYPEAKIINVDPFANTGEDFVEDIQQDAKTFLEDIIV